MSTRELWYSNKIENKRMNTGSNTKPVRKTTNTQKQSFFNCLLDMAAMEKSGGSRTGSLSIEASHDAVNSQTHLLHGHQNGDAENGSLAALARRTTMRKRSVK